MMACYGRVGYEQLKDCVPGVGAMSARDVRAQLPANAEMTTGKYQYRAPKEIPTATLQVDGRWLRAFLVNYRIPNRGLTPESAGAVLEVVDLSDRSTVASIDMPNTRLNAVLPDTANGQFIAALTEYEHLLDGGHRNNGPKIDSTMVAVDPKVGTVVWQKNDVLTSNPNAVIDRGILPAYGVPDGECDGYTIARTAEVLDTKSGAPKWSKHVTELRGPKNGEQCTPDVVYADPQLPFVMVTREGHSDHMGVQDNHNIRTNLDVDTGETFAPLPTEFFGEGHFADTAGPLVLLEVIDKVQIGRSGKPSELVVIDREKDAIVNRIPAGTLAQVGAGVVGLFDSQIYLWNSATFSIDARTNVEGDTVKAVPLREVNGWLLHDDGSFTAVA